MARAKVYNLLKEEVGTTTLKPEVFNVDFKENLIHDVVVAYLANQRQGTKSTLTRSEVRGKAAKPWAQKGTGRARHGSRKAPQWTGGGVAFAPKPRKFIKKVNKNAKKTAFKSAISKKYADGQLTLVENFAELKPKTKEFVNVLNKFNLDKKVLVVVDSKNENLTKATNNLENVKITLSNQLNTYDLVTADNLLVTKDAVKSIQEVYVEK